DPLQIRANGAFEISDVNHTPFAAIVAYYPPEECFATVGMQIRDWTTVEVNDYTPTKALEKYIFAAIADEGMLNPVRAFHFSMHGAQLKVDGVNTLKRYTWPADGEATSRLKAV